MPATNLQNHTKRPESSQHTIMQASLGKIPLKQVLVKDDKPNGKLEFDSLSQTEIDNYINKSIEKEKKIFINTTFEPRTSQLWSTFAYRNLLIGPLCTALAAIDGDPLACAVFPVNMGVTAFQDIKALNKRYNDIAKDEFVKPDIKPPKYNLKDVFKDRSKTLPFIQEKCVRNWQRFGFTPQATLEGITALAFCPFLIYYSRDHLKKNWNKM